MGSRRSRGSPRSPASHRMRLLVLAHDEARWPSSIGPPYGGHRGVTTGRSAHAARSGGAGVIRRGIDQQAKLGLAVLPFVLLRGVLLHRFQDLGVVRSLEMFPTRTVNGSHGCCLLYTPAGTASAAPERGAECIATLDAGRPVAGFGHR